MLVKKRFKRPCSLCGKIFKPTGKFVKLCDNCYRKRISKGRPRKDE